MMENTETEQLNNSNLRMSSMLEIYIKIKFLASKPNFAETIFQIQKKRIEELMTHKKLREIEEGSKKIYDSYELK